MEDVRGEDSGREEMVGSFVSVLTVAGLMLVLWDSQLVLVLIDS
jgi:hypothetical protein